VLEGDSARQIRQQLRDKEWIPVSVDAVEQKDKNKSSVCFNVNFQPMIWHS
jgi:general secretion pathway protein F